MRDAKTNRPMIEPLEERRLLSVQQFADPVPVGLTSGVKDYTISNMVTVGEKLYFATDEDIRSTSNPHRLSFWRTDGVHRPTAFQTFADSRHVEASLFTAGQTLVAAIDNEQFDPNEIGYVTQLWALGSNGKLAKIADGLQNFEVFYQTPTLTYFTVAPAPNFRQLWVTDGTSKGTVLLNQAGPNAHYNWDTDYMHPVEFQGRLYFIPGPTQQPELWSTDGTKKGTVRDARITKLIGPSKRVFNLCAQGNKLYLSLYDSARNHQLWVTDGTQFGTIELANNIAPFEMIPTENSVYLWTTNSSNLSSLYRSDGTRRGTVLVKTLPKNDELLITQAVGGTLYFQIEDPSVTGSLWYASDGTAVAPVQTDWPSNTESFSAVGDQIFLLSSQPYLARGDLGQYHHIAKLPAGTYAWQMVKFGDRYFFPLFPYNYWDPSGGLWFYQQ